MKKFLPLILLSALAVTSLGAQANVAEEPQIAPAVELEVEATIQIPGETCSAVNDFGLPSPTTVNWGGLPSCWPYQGNSCSPPGSWFRCMLAPYEPGICICLNGSWSCA